MGSSHMQEAAEANAGGISVTEEAGQLLDRAFQLSENAFGLFAQSHMGSDQDGSAQAMDMLMAAKERIDEARAAIREAVQQAQTVRF